MEIREADGVHSNELSSLDGEREIVRLMQFYGTFVCAVEEHGGHAFRTGLQATANALGVPLTLVDLKMKQTQKAQRIIGFFKEAEAGRVMVCKEADPTLLEHFFRQVRNYPQVDHDDALDAAAYTCDPNVAENWTPAWGSAFAGVRRYPWQVDQTIEPEYRTRYCLT